jgi:GNAT superfamily N-acetyltransferase
VIREATTADVPRLVAMGTRFLSETVYRGRMTVTPVQMADTVHMLLASPAGTVFVAERDGNLVGMIGLLFYTQTISGEATVAELFWWVEPEHRGNGVRLLKRAEKWAVERGATAMHMVAPTPDVGALYTALGYELIESTYQRTLP